MRLRIDVKLISPWKGLGYPRDSKSTEFLHSFFIGYFGMAHIPLTQIFI